MKERQLLIQGLETNFKIAGEGESLLILHGWGGSSNSWIEVQEILANEGFKVIIPDLPGFGKTTSPPVAWSVEDYSNFILNFIKKIGLERVTLMGHSFGGRISIKFTTLCPERVKKLILCASAGLKHNLSFKQKIIYNLARFGNFLFSKRPLRRYKDVFSNFFYFLVRRRDYHKLKRVMKSSFQKIVIEDLKATLPKIKAKTLLIWGEKDKSVPLEDGYIMKEEIPQSVLEIIPKAGHTLNLEEPEKLAEVILKFLK